MNKLPRAVRGRVAHARRNGTGAVGVVRASGKLEMLLTPAEARALAAECIRIADEMEHQEPVKAGGAE